MKDFIRQRLIESLLDEGNEETREKAIQVIALVKSGHYNVSQACEKIGISRASLSRVLTPEEKVKLKQAKMMHSNPRDKYY